jgi:hypothetical protein
MRNLRVSCSGDMLLRESRPDRLYNEGKTDTLEEMSKLDYKAAADSISRGGMFSLSNSPPFASSLPPQLLLKRHFVGGRNQNWLTSFLFGSLSLPFPGIHNLGLDRTGTDRVEPMLSVRLGPSISPRPIGSVHLDIWDRSIWSRFKFPSVRPIGPKFL